MSWIKLSVLLLAAVGVFHFHRAWNLAVTTDEAFTALSFASPSWLQILTRYDANHHILHSFLCKLSLAAFGWHELALRLPSLLACLLWLILTCRLASRLCPDSPLHFVLCAWLVLHPALFDWFSLARGYSLALAFLLAAIYELTGPLPAFTRASLFLGLSAASNPVFAIPAAAIAIAWPASHSLQHRRIWARLPDLAVPGAAIAILITAIPLSRAESWHFYFGAPTLLASLHSLFGIPEQTVLSYALILMVPLVLAAALGYSRRDENLRFLAYALALCLLAAAAMRAAGIPYPRGRTGTYLTLLWILCAFRLAALAESAFRIQPYRLPRRYRMLPLPWARQGLWAALLVPAVFFAVSIPTGYVREWRHDAGNRAVMDYLLETGESRPSIAASSMLVFGLEFYRRRAASAQWPEIQTFNPGDSSASSPDYLILRTDDIPVQPPPAYAPVFRDATSGIILYRR
jgi:hypothetical protein